MYRIFALGLMAFIFTACSKQPPPTNTPATANANQPAAPTGPGKQSRSTPVKANFTNPKTAVDTFVAAVQNQDIEVLSQCFDPETPSEFQSFINKSTDPRELEKLAAHFDGATVTEVKSVGETAIANVTFKSGDSEIQLKKTSNGWKILTF